MRNVELYPKSEIALINEASAAIQKNTADLLSQADAVEKIRTELSAMGSSYKSIIDLSGRLDKQQKQLDATEKQVIATKERVARSYRVLTQEEVNQRVSSQQTRREMVALAKESLAPVGSLNQLRAQLVLLRIEAGKLEPGMPGADAMKKQITELDTVISKAEQNMGVWGRNVGNYGSAFTGLNFQVQQLARELPNLAQSPTTFIMSIGNNFPMFTDELSRAIAKWKEYKEQIAQGIDAPKVERPIKQVLSSLLSWQTAIIIGITLLIKYSDEIINWTKSLFTAEKALFSTAEALEKVNEAMDVSDFGKKIANFERLRKAYAEIGDNAKAKEQFLIDYREQIDKTGISVLTLIDADNLFINNSAAYISAIKLRTQANAAQSLAEKEFANQFKAQVAADKKIAAEGLEAKLEYLRELPSGSMIDTGYTVGPTGAPLKTADISVEEAIQNTEKRIIAIRKEEVAAAGLADTYNNLFATIDAQAQEIVKNAGFKELETGSAGDIMPRTRSSTFNDERRAMEELATADIDARIGVIKRTLAADKTATSDRMTLTNELYDLEIERIAELDNIRRESIEQEIADNPIYAEDGSIDIVRTEQMRQNRLIALQFSTDAAIMQSVDERIKAINELEDNQINEILRNVERQMQERQRVIDESESNELTALSAQYSGILSNQEEYEQKRLEITRKYADQRQIVELEALETQLSELKKDTNITIDEEQKILDLEQQIADFKVEINRDANERIIEDDERTFERRAQMYQSIKESVLKIFSSIVEASALSTDKQINDLERESQENSDNADEEQARIERLAEAGAISEEEKNARIELSKQQAAAKEEQLEVRKRELQARQARYEQGLALVQTAINGAEAISKAFAQLGPIAGAIAAIAIGATIAVQIAKIASTKAPQYAEGTPIGGHPGGPAWVGDGGRAEGMRIGNRWYKTPSTPTLIPNLPKGAEVISDWNDVIRFGIMQNLVIRESLPIGNAISGISNYNDHGVTTRLDKQIGQTNKLIREIRISRKSDKFTAFKNIKIGGIN